MTPAGSPPPGAGVVRWLRPFVLLLVLLVLDAPAAAPSLAWAARGDGGQPLNRHATLELLRSPAGHLVVGATLTRTNGQTAYVVSAFDEQGQPLWRTEHVSTNQSENTLRRMIQDDSGHLLLTGTSDTLKLSPTGQVLWTAPHGGRDVACDTNGHAYLTGHRSNAVPLLKLDAVTGTNVWERFLDVTEVPPGMPSHLPWLHAEGLAAAVTVDQSVCLLGRSGYGLPRLGSVFALAGASYSTDGRQHWFQSRVGGTNVWSGIDSFGDVMQVVRLLPAVDGGVVFALNNSANYHATFSLADTGALRWVHFYHPLGIEPGTAALAQGPAGEVLITGGQGSDWNTYSYRTVLFMSDGQERWATFRPQPPVPPERKGHYQGRAVALDPAAGLAVVTGGGSRWRQWGVLEPPRVITVAFESATGRELWHQYYPGPVPGHHEATGVAVDGRGAVYVAGHSDNAQGGRDLLLLKYAPAARAQVTPGGDVAVTIPAAPGTPVTLEATTDFAAWSAVGTVLAGTNAAARVVDTNAVQRFPGRFYRPRP